MPYPFSLRVYCKLTCQGGSERGHCDCQRPTDCTQTHHSQFAAAREDAIAAGWTQSLITFIDKKKDPHEQGN